MIIRIYYADICCLEDEKIYKNAMQFLTKERIKKIEQYQKKGDRLRGAGAGLLLEYGLKQYGLSQKQLQFTKGAHGKPEICTESIFFNLTHSGNYVATAFAEVPVGIDIEHIEKSREKVIQRFFSEEEKEFLRDTSDASAFTRIWTRKESYIKATGLGMYESLESFSTVGEQVTDEYFLKSYEILADYWISVCTKGKIIEELVEKIDFTQFF